MASDPLLLRQTPSSRASQGRERPFDFLKQFLARHSVPVSPEQIAPAEGTRAAVATVVALLPAIYEHQAVLAWAGFAAFWSCLIEPGGTAREQFRILGLFTACGTILGGVTSLIAVYPLWGVLPWLVLTGLMAGLARALSPSIALLCALLSCVMLAGTGFPAHRFQDALVVALAFGSGGLWAAFLCLVVWPQHPYAPARRAVGACYRLLSVMAGEIAAGRLQETVHRQNVRTAIERARGLALQIDAGHASYGMRGRLMASLAGAERLFTAMLAVEHLVETRGLDFEARGTLAAFSALCQHASDAALEPSPDLEHLAAEGLALAGTIPATAGPVGELVATSARTLGTLAEGLAQKARLPFDGELPRHAARLTPTIWQHALRLVVGLLATYLTSWWLDLDYGFWALVAVLLVIQPSGQTTLVRALERVLGTLGGGVLALLLTPFLPGSAQMLAAVALFVIGAIAMRAVNYTMLVVFISAQFIVVTEMLMPSQGIAWMRVLDNTLGSVIGLLCAFMVCPQRRGQDMDGLLQAAVIGNLRYVSAVLKREDPVTTDRVQRQAGIDTTRAEFARGSLPVLGGVSAVGERATQAHALLRALRRLSGEATLLRFDISAGLCEGDAQAGERWSATAAALEAGAPFADIAQKIENGDVMAEIAALERAGRKTV
ncbi:FUSC family protein [Gluconobacter kondonii]|uniref:FUSC family protein n=1 Tax=Gluconobacter kondonii TaxID=941463 RepID=UPI001B8C33D6|nr:FUSC family protein [Gluconobacter kondonii]MBS1052394.1 FUSC family protein [Gluconobacter kondonii]MBS1055648.1 FUSC family protein [Gluconobacter kondonii]